jgi:hypothetical protein
MKEHLGVICSIYQSHLGSFLMVHNRKFSHNLVALNVSANTTQQRLEPHQLYFTAILRNIKDSNGN